MLHHAGRGRVGQKAFAAADEKRLTRDARPQPDMVFERQPIGRAGAQVRIELPAKSAVGILLQAVGRQMHRLIGTYVDKYQGLRSSGETVIIDGLCASACTLILGSVPHDRICVTSRANLGFHAAWDFGANGREATNPDATQMLYSMYPSPVRRWIAARGGLKPQMIFLRGKQLMSMYRPCYLAAHASSAH
jgi:hypothetical protein